MKETVFQLVFTFDHLLFTGAGSDLQSATAIARTMVYTLGMSEKLGLVTFTKGDGPEKFSPETVNLAEQEVRRILDVRTNTCHLFVLSICDGSLLTNINHQESYQRAKNLLISKKHELHLLADALLKYETLTLDQIKLVISGAFFSSLLFSPFQQH
jgi:ATP-dependent metalloprotease